MVVGAEGLAKTVEASVLFHPAAESSEGANVAATEAVDCLLGVADEEGLGAAGAEEKL